MDTTTTTGLTDDARTTLLELLRPWLRVLRERTFLAGAYDIGRLAPSDVVWLRLPATWEVDLRVFEAFELLALAGGVDYQLWRLALSNVADGRALRADGRATEGTPCRIGCVLSFSGLDEFPNAIVAWSGRVVAGADPETASQEYIRARDWLESLHSEKREATVNARDVEHHSVVVPVRIWLHEGSFEERMEQLSQVAAVQHRRNNSVASETEWNSLFEVIEMDPGTPDLVTARAIQAMTEIASRGILMERLKPNGMEVTEATAAIFACTLPKLFGSTDPTAASDPMSAAVSIVELPVFLPLQTVTALFSALRTSQSVHTLAMNCALSPWQPDPDDAPRMSRSERDHFWRWVAFSIFGHHAAHSVNELRIDVAHLTADDVHALRDQLERPECVPLDPSGDDSTVGEISGSTIVSSFHSTCPALRDGVTTRQADAIPIPPQEVHVVGSNAGEWRQILVSGYGLAWAKSKDIGIFSASTRGHAYGIRHLAIDNIDLRSKYPVLELLRVVGGGLTNLSIIGLDDSTALDDWLLGVFEACPQLEAFAVHGRLTVQSMDVFTDMLRHGVWRIPRLQLDHLHVVDQGSIESFFQTLANTRNDAIQRLRHVQLSVEGVDISATEVVDSVATALRSNHTLCQLHLKLSFRPQARIKTELWTAVRLLHGHNLEPICIRRAPLPLDKKLGFLSVVATTAGQANEETASLIVRHLMQAMDRPLISLVFEFAAECERRIVSVRLAKDE